MPAPSSRKAKNPFYALVLLVGLAFLLTACAYTVLAFLDVRGHGSTTAESDLLVFLNRHGIMLFGIELAVLCVAMVAAFATEDYWQRRLDRRLGIPHNERRTPSADSHQEAPEDESAGSPTAEETSARPTGSHVSSPQR